MPIAPVILPLAMAVVVFRTPSKRWRPRLFALTAMAHLALTLFAIRSAAPPVSAWLRLDPPGRLLLAVVSLLFCACAVYSVGYLGYRAERANRRFCACMLAALGTMSLVAYAQHLGLLWVAMEATTLAAAPLIYFNRTPQSIEATWKYLMISSIGIALALLGSFFVGYASLLGHGEGSLLFGDLLAGAPLLSRPWLRAGFALLLVGYGAKMGLAPMHTWKPDAYGEAPGVVGAILAGGLTSCAYLAVLRLTQIARAAGEGVYCSRLLLAIGLFSMAVAGALMLGQRDLKRMLAYSSVEHMGILALAAGLGVGTAFAALFHLVNNALAKGLSFSPSATSTAPSAARRRRRCRGRCGGCLSRRPCSCSPCSPSPGRRRSPPS
jgi:hydrogenase-4 component F